jgi:phage baseplate assembly protein W
MNFVDMADTIGSSGTQIPNDKGEEAIKHSIHNILSTSPGSMPGHPAFGCGMDKYLFELIDPLMAKMIEEEIVYALKTWEPRVNVHKIDVIEDEDYNRLVIKIAYTIIRDPENTEREFIYKSQRAV